MRLLTLLLTCIAVTLAAPASAQVYKWVDKDGVVHYTDKPPTPNAKPVDLPKLQRMDTLEEGPGTPSKPMGRDETSKAGPALPTVTIVQPKPDETLWGTNRTIPVRTTLSQALPPGYSLMYLLDGSANGMAATTATSTVFSDVDRGSHLVTVQIVDQSGKVLSSAGPVMVHLKQPIAK